MILKPRRIGNSSIKAQLATLLAYGGLRLFISTRTLLKSLELLSMSVYRAVTIIRYVKCTKYFSIKMKIQGKGIEKEEKGEVPRRSVKDAEIYKRFAAKHRRNIHRPCPVLFQNRSRWCHRRNFQMHCQKRAGGLFQSRRTRSPYNLPDSHFESVPDVLRLVYLGIQCIWPGQAKIRKICLIIISFAISMITPKIKPISLRYIIRNLFRFVSSGYDSVAILRDLSNRRKRMKSAAGINSLAKRNAQNSRKRYSFWMSHLNKPSWLLINGTVSRIISIWKI